MSIAASALSPVPASAGLWRLAWTRLKREPVGLVSLAVVALYVLLMAASAAGLVAGDWSREAGVSYAPPTFQGPDTVLPGSAAAPASASAPAAEDLGIPDPLADALAAIGKELAGETTAETKAATLPLGGDKWGRDVLKKAVKGTETSMVVGLAAAALAVLLGTFFGAQAGYLGGRVDDFFNWLYSVFTAIPYLLLVLAIAAVLNQKGVATVILILGLTGWTGTFRLVRAEYLRHKVREYVLAADAIGASPARRITPTSSRT